MVSRVESGERDATPDFVLALARAWDMGTDDLLALAGLAEQQAPMPSNEHARAELLAIFNRLDHEDQIRLIENAKSLRAAAQRLKGRRGER